MQSAAANSQSAIPRVFTVGAVVLVIAFGVASTMSTIRANSPLARVTERLVQSGKFEVLNTPWDPSWAVLGLEQAPWTDTTPGAVGLDQIDPNSQLVVLNLWATWCEPCRTELPAMFELAREYRKLPVTFMFVGYEDGWEAPKALFKSITGTMPRHVAIARDPKGEPGGDQDPETFWARLGATGIPETFFIKDGVVLGKVVGAINWKHPDVREYIDLLLGRRMGEG